MAVASSEEVMKDCAVAILNWNGADFLKKYLPSVVSNSDDNIQIYVIDNGSTDNSLKVLESEFPSVKVIQLDQNYGFAGGYNRGLKEIEEPIYCLMNSDIEVGENWSVGVLEYFNENKNVAAIQPKILDSKDKTKFEYAGGSGGYCDRFGYSVCRGRFFDHIEEDQGQYDDIVDILWGSGCCLFVRRDVYWEVGGLDKDYFAHQEEIDLCWRINNYGYKVKAFPQSVVYHLGGGSLAYGSYFKAFLNFRNSLFNLSKNLKLHQLIIVLPIRLVLDGVAAFHSVFKTKSMTVVMAILRAHLEFYISIPKLILKRQKIKHKGFPATTSKKFILIDYFIYNCKYYSELLK